MTRRRSPWVAAAVLVVMAGFVVVLAAGSSSDDRAASSPLLGRQAPPIVASTLDGESFALDGLRGRFVVVNFFATWCIPCIREHPELVEFERRNAEADDTAVVSVVFDDRPETVRQFFADNGGDWPVVTDPDGRIAVSYGVAGVPESYLVAPDGTVVTKIVGGVTADELDDLVDRARSVAR